MQKLAEAKLAARPSAEARGQAPAAAALPRKEAPLLFDLVYAGAAGLCIKASSGSAQCAHQLATALDMAGTLILYRQGGRGHMLHPALCFRWVWLACRPSATRATPLH